MRSEFKATEDSTMEVFLGRCRQQYRRPKPERAVFCHPSCHYLPGHTKFGTPTNLFTQKILIVFKEPHSVNRIPQIAGGLTNKDFIIEQTTAMRDRWFPYLVILCSVVGKFHQKSCEANNIPEKGSSFPVAWTNSSERNK